jgi:NitT/TauT family transport system permease protein
VELRGDLHKSKKLMVELIGGGAIVLLWFILTEFQIIPKGIFPSPFAVLSSYGELYNKDDLLANVIYSFSLNSYGLLEAILFAIPIGFAIGLDKYVKAIFERYTTVIRFLPLTAVTGIFIAWFGIGDMMKVQFLAFSIFIFLLPSVIQRVNEIPEVYVQTVQTLGASKWQAIRYVFIPGVLSSVYDDIRVLAALSWTYVVVVELINTTAGGVGAMAYLAGRQSRIDKVFAVLVTIILIGFLQDKALKWLGTIFFAHKNGEQK